MRNSEKTLKGNRVSCEYLKEESLAEKRVTYKWPEWNMSHGLRTINGLVWLNELQEGEGSVMVSSLGQHG